MPYSALFAQSKSYFTHKVRGCQTFLQRIDKLFFILIYCRHFLCPPFRISFFVPLTLTAAEPDIVPRRAARRGFIHAPRPARTSFYKRIYPRRILPTISSTKHSCSYFFGFASAFSDRTALGLAHRHTERCPRYDLFPSQAKRARPSPSPKLLFSAHLSAPRPTALRPIRTDSPV